MRSIRNLAVMVLVGVLLLTACGFASAKESLIIYTSMKESLIRDIVDGFAAKYPGTEVDYQSAGAGRLMAKIAAERESGKILADILWTSEVPDFYNMRKDGILEQYKTPLINEILNPFDDYDGCFTAARLGTLGIAINTDLIKTAPKEWSDLFKPEYKGVFGIADPSLSGTAYMSVAMLEKKFGWEFFEKLHANEARIGKGSGQVVDDTSFGELSACLAVDYITNDKITNGAPLALHYPPELLMAPSPIAIFKGSPNLETAKKFVDYLLSHEAQVLIAGEGTLSVRTDVEYPEGFMLPEAKEVLQRAIKIDYIDMMDKKEEMIKKFTDILQGRK